MHRLPVTSRGERLGCRRRAVGVVRHWTGRTLLPYLTALENRALPLTHARVPRDGRTACTRATSGPRAPANSSTCWASCTAATGPRPSCPGRAAARRRRGGHGERSPAEPSAFHSSESVPVPAAARRSGVDRGGDGGDRAARARADAGGAGSDDGAGAVRRQLRVRASRVLPADEPTGEVATASRGGRGHGPVPRERGVRRDGSRRHVRPARVRPGAPRGRIHGGRISTGISRERGGEGEEFTFLDRASGIRLPWDRVEGCGWSGRVRPVGEAGHVGVWPDRDGRSDG